MAKAFPNTGVTTGLSTDRSAMTGMGAGQQFFETDTNKTYVYNGSSWIQENDYTVGAMSVDSSGRVRMPNQPVFSAGRSAGPVAVGNTILFNTIIFNDGNCYNSSNGLFTAPITGRYVFNFHGMTTSSGYGWFAFIRNGADYLYGYNEASPVSVAYYHVSMSAPVYMSANDTFGVVIKGSSAFFGNGYNAFSGYLLS